VLRQALIWGDRNIGAMAGVGGPQDDSPSTPEARGQRDQRVVAERLDCCSTPAGLAQAKRYVCVLGTAPPSSGWPPLESVRQVPSESKDVGWTYRSTKQTDIATRITELPRAVRFWPQMMTFLVSLRRVSEGLCSANR